METLIREACPPQSRFRSDLIQCDPQQLRHLVPQPNLAQIAANIGNPLQNELDHVIVARLVEIGSHHLLGKGIGGLTFKG